MKMYHCIQGVTCVTCYASVLDEGCPNASISTILTFDPGWNNLQISTQDCH